MNNQPQPPESPQPMPPAQQPAPMSAPPMQQQSAPGPLPRAACGRPRQGERRRQPHKRRHGQRQRQPGQMAAAPPRRRCVGNHARRHQHGYACVMGRARRAGLTGVSKGWGIRAGCAAGRRALASGAARRACRHPGHWQGRKKTQIVRCAAMCRARLRRLL